jgi:hypothetical protein
MLELTDNADPTLSPPPSRAPPRLAAPSQPNQTHNGSAAGSGRVEPAVVAGVAGVCVATDLDESAGNDPRFVSGRGRSCNSGPAGAGQFAHSATTLKPEQVDSVTLLGQDFPPALLARLSRQTLRWVPLDAPDKPVDLRWKGVVSVGEEQQIRGTIQATKRQKLSIRFGTQILDSLWLKPGEQSFALRFSAPARGRTETVLFRDNEPLDTIRFFGQGTRPLTIQFLLNTPDFETKTLADWLGRQGNRVALSSTLSPGIEANLQINAAAKPTKTSNSTPDLVITEPGLVGQPLVKRALADRKSVLVLNLSNPPAEAALINRVTGTNFRFQKVTNEETIPAGNGLTALPYRFAPALNQFAVRGNPVAVQQVGGKVAVSLFSETFPLKLSGNSVAYARIWNTILAKLQPVQVDNFSVEGPVLPAHRQLVLVNNPSGQTKLLKLAGDTVPLVSAALNPQSLTTQYRFQKPGWQPLADSVEVFVEAGSVKSNQYVNNWLIAHNRYQPGNAQIARTREQRIPDWVWLVLVLGCLTALWLEPKL